MNVKWKKLAFLSVVSASGLAISQATMYPPKTVHIKAEISTNALMDGALIACGSGHGGLDVMKYENGQQVVPHISAMIMNDQQSAQSQKIDVSGPGSVKDVSADFTWNVADYMPVNVEGDLAGDVRVIYTCKDQYVGWITGRFWANGSSSWAPGKYDTDISLSAAANIIHFGSGTNPY